MDIAYYFFPLLVSIVLAFMVGIVGTLILLIVSGHMVASCLLGTMIGVCSLRLILHYNLKRSIIRIAATDIIAADVDTIHTDSHSD